MQCPSCNSDQTQRVEVIYENGTQDIKTTSTSVGLASTGRGLGLGTARTSTSGKSQSLAAQRLAPPPKKGIGGGLLSIFIGFVMFSGNGGVAFFGALLLILGAYLIYKSLDYNKKTWPGLYATWQATWYCNKCGTTYQLNT